MEHTKPNGDGKEFRNTSYIAKNIMVQIERDRVNGFVSYSSNSIIPNDV